MNTSHAQNGAQAQGAVAPLDLSPSQIEEMLKRDLSVAIHCLEAIYQDPDGLKTLAEIMAGRYLNYNNAKVQAKAAK